MFGLILLLFSAYLGSSSELDLDIALVGGRQAERQYRVVLVVAGGVISPLIFSIVILARCYPLYPRYWVWVITITDILISHTNISPTTHHHHHHCSPLDQSKSNLPQILHTGTLWCPTYIMEM